MSPRGDDEHMTLPTWRVRQLQDIEQTARQIADPFALDELADAIIEDEDRGSEWARVRAALASGVSLPFGELLADD